MRELVQILAATTLALILPACGKQDTAPEHTAGDTGTAQRPADTGTAGDPVPFAQIRMLPFDLKNIPSQYQYDGDAIGGARWSDANGENMVIVSTSSVPAEEGTKQNIFGYQYVGAGSAMRRLWKIQDAAENWCDKGDGLVSEIVVKDLDGNGIAENAFVYNVQGSCDVSPRPFKLMLHSGETKYAVRGTNTVLASQEPGTKPDGGEKNFDPAFDSAPAAFRTFASEMWDEHVK